MKTITIFLFLIITSCSNDTTKGKKEVVNQKKSTTQLVVDTYIQSRLPGWFLAPSESWEDTSINKYQSDTAQINYISGDFNCDGKVDYSLVLKDSNSIYSIFEILSLDGNYYHRELERFDNYKTKKLDFGLQALLPGPIHHTSGPPPTITPCGAIQKFFTDRESKKIYFYDKEGRANVLRFGE